jgi:hypothetical protein
VSTELRIELRTGKAVAIARHYFRDSAKAIQQKLMTIQATVGR